MTVVTCVCVCVCLRAVCTCVCGVLGTETVFTLQVLVLDVQHKRQVYPHHTLPLTPRAKLEWLGYAPGIHEHTVVTHCNYSSSSSTSHSTFFSSSSPSSSSSSSSHSPFPSSSVSVFQKVGSWLVMTQRVWSGHSPTLISCHGNRYLTVTRSSRKTRVTTTTSLE